VVSRTGIPIRHDLEHGPAGPGGRLCHLIRASPATSPVPTPGRGTVSRRSEAHLDVPYGNGLLELLEQVDVQVHAPDLDDLAASMR
jgi:hypothetical protein